MQNAGHEQGTEGGAEKFGMDGDLQNIRALVEGAMGDHVASFLIVVKDEKGGATMEVIRMGGAASTTNVCLPMRLQVDESIQICFRRHTDCGVDIGLAPTCDD